MTIQIHRSHLPRYRKRQDSPSVRDLYGVKKKCHRISLLLAQCTSREPGDHGFGSEHAKHRAGQKHWSQNEKRRNEKATYFCGPVCSFTTAAEKKVPLLPFLLTAPSLAHSALYHLIKSRTDSVKGWAQAAGRSERSNRQDGDSSCCETSSRSARDCFYWGGVCVFLFLFCFEGEQKKKKIGRVSSATLQAVNLNAPANPRTKVKLKWTPTLTSTFSQGQLLSKSIVARYS